MTCQESVDKQMLWQEERAEPLRADMDIPGWRKPTCCSWVMEKRPSPQVSWLTCIPWHLELANLEGVVGDSCDTLAFIGRLMLPEPQQNTVAVERAGRCRRVNPSRSEVQADASSILTHTGGMRPPPRLLPAGASASLETAKQKSSLPQA